MSVNYSPVLWNKQKKLYDLILWIGILFMAVTFIIFQVLFHKDITLQTLIIRTTAIIAFFLLHIILIIGPLCRIDKRFLPLLYNRRHLGVSMFLVALIHGGMAIVQFHTLGDTNPIASIFTANSNYLAISDFPFQVLGFLALIILFLMAITSHDFWLKNLSPAIWKGLHMCVYLAYTLIVIHVATGALQYEDNPIYWTLLVLGVITITGLHLYTGIIETRKLSLPHTLEKEGYYKVCSLEEIDDQCGKSVFINGENIAIFKYDGNVSAVHNVCKHQMGPIGEGKIIDGCITCPWHGYQYLPDNGQSPPPFNEKLKTYRTSVLDGSIWVHPLPLEEGSFIEPTKIPQS